MSLPGLILTEVAAHHGAHAASCLARIGAWSGFEHVLDVLHRAFEIALILL